MSASIDSKSSSEYSGVPSAVEEPEFQVSEPLRKDGKQLEVLSGDRKGAMLFSKIRVINKSRDEEDLRDITFSVDDDVEINAGDNQAFIGKIVAIGQGGRPDTLAEKSEVFIQVYWYYAPKEIKKYIIDANVEQGIPFRDGGKMICVSFHCDEIDPVSLGYPLEVFFSADFPKDQNKMEARQFCCSHVMDAQSLDDSEFDAVTPIVGGSIYSISDNDFLDTPTKDQKPFHLDSMVHFLRKMRKYRPYPHDTTPCIMPVQPGKKKSKKPAKASKTGSNAASQRADGRSARNRTSPARKSRRGASSSSSSEDDEDQTISSLAKNQKSQLAKPSKRKSSDSRDAPSDAKYRKKNISGSGREGDSKKDAGGKVGSSKTATADSKSAAKSMDKKSPVYKSRGEQVQYREQ